MAAPAQEETKTEDAERASADLHTMLAGVREQMEFILREKLREVEDAFHGRLADRDKRIKAADAMIDRLRQDADAARGDAERARADLDRAIEDATRAQAKLDKLRELARE